MTNKLRKQIENADWYVTKVTDGYELSKFSPAGEDYYITVEEATLLEDIKSEYENFDAEEHAEMWFQYRGLKGVPNSLRKLLEDADEIKSMLKELYEIVEKYFEPKDEVIVEKKTKRVTIKD